MYVLQAALPQGLGGLAAPVLYIDTEGKFSSDVSPTAFAAVPLLQLYVNMTSQLCIKYVYCMKYLSMGSDGELCTTRKPGRWGLIDSRRICMT
jgi:hypothetical protein